jgi:hypothetical protein
MTRLSRHQYSILSDLPLPHPPLPHPYELCWTGKGFSPFLPVQDWALSTFSHLLVLNVVNFGHLVEAYMSLFWCRGRPQRKGMGLLEYQAMPSMRDMRVFCVHSVIDQPQTVTSSVVPQGRRHGPSITYRITPCSSTLLQPVRRAVVLGQPSSQRPPPPYRQSFSNN